MLVHVKKNHRTYNAVMEQNHISLANLRYAAYALLKFD